MKQMLSSLLILSSLVSVVHSARYSLLRITESKESAALDQVADFSSIFEEENLHEKYRDLLLSEGLAFSLSMSLATKFPEEAPTPATPTSVPAPISLPTDLPVSSPSSTPVFTNSTDEAVSAAGEQEDGSVNLSTAGSKTPNVALIVIGSCVLAGLAVFAAKKLKSRSDDSPLYGTLLKGGSSEVSSIKTSDNVISTTNSLDSDLMHNIEM